MSKTKFLSDFADAAEDRAEAKGLLEGLCTTQGITSRVYAADRVVGHILLADYDEGWSDKHIRRDTESRPGINLLFESSPGSLHYWNLTVETPAQKALKMLSMAVDPSHIQMGWRRKEHPSQNGPYWVLRISEKTNRNNQNPARAEGKYKTRPELMKVWFNPCDKPQSRPHWDFARKWWDIPEPEMADVYEWEGSEIDTSTYATFTDDAKAVLRGDDDG